MGFVSFTFGFGWPRLSICAEREGLPFPVLEMGRLAVVQKARTRVIRGDAGHVVSVESLVKLRRQRTNLLGYYQAYFHCLLSGASDDFSSDDPLRALPRHHRPYVVLYTTHL